MEPDLKEICKVFWMVKGHLVEEKTMRESYPGYFKRLWGNHEAIYHEEGFEDAWKNWLAQNS